MSEAINRLCSFLNDSVSAYHAVASISDILSKNGYMKLEECGKWSLKTGGKYYTTRNQSSIIAFTIPENDACTPFLAVASHSDSPVFRIKERAELHVKNKYTLLNTERYGGMIMSTWFDRPLSVAGRVIIKTDNGIESRLVNIDRDSLIIPNLAIHMNRNANENTSLNAQIDMMPLYGDQSAENTFDAMIAEAAGVSTDRVLGSDLFVYNRMQPSVWGREDSYISSPRIDDLECAYTSLEAFLNSSSDKHINFLCVFDNEEVGSGTRQGADSTFFEDVVARIYEILGYNRESMLSAIASSFVVSADNSHAVHPNHPEKSDAENCPYMNEGIVIKFSANQKYTTDGMSKAIFAEICRKADVPVQFFSNRSDSTGGSTLGNISCAHVSVPTLDIGLAQLAMHSSFETAGAKDVEYMIDALKAFYSSDLIMHGDGKYTLS